MSEHLPIHTYGVDVAMWKLRPGARFQLEGTNFTQWEDPNGLNPPTWDEVMDQIMKDKAEADALHESLRTQNEPIALQAAEAENPLPPTVPPVQRPDVVPEFTTPPIPLAGSR